MFSRALPLVAIAFLLLQAQGRADIYFYYYATQVLHFFGGDDWDGWLATVLTPRWYDAFVAVWRRPWMSLASDTYGASLLDVLVSVAEGGLQFDFLGSPFADERFLIVRALLISQSGEHGGHTH
jgi:hypothetical protein